MQSDKGQLALALFIYSNPLPLKKTMGVSEPKSDQNRIYSFLLGIVYLGVISEFGIHCYLTLHTFH